MVADNLTFFTTVFFEYLFNLYYGLCPRPAHRRQTPAGRAELLDTVLVISAKIIDMFTGVQIMNNSTNTSKSNNAIKRRFAFKDAKQVAW